MYNMKLYTFYLVHAIYIIVILHIPKQNHNSNCPINSKWSKLSSSLHYSIFFYLLKKPFHSNIHHYEKYYRDFLLMPTFKEQFQHVHSDCSAVCVLPRVFSNGLQCMSQPKLKSEKGVVCGERDDTLPPGYRKEDLVSWRSYIFSTFAFLLSFCKQLNEEFNQKQRVQL